MSAADLHGEDAERTVPSYLRSVLALLREKGHTVTVRRSARNSSWYYTVDGQREVRGGLLCRRYKRYGL